MTVGYRRVVKTGQCISRDPAQGGVKKFDEAVELISVKTTTAIYKTIYRQKLLHNSTNVIFYV